MQKLTKRKQQGKETKEKILSIALEILEEKGFENMSINEICERAEVSTGAFYHHFSGKEGIIVEGYRQTDDYFVSEVIGSLKGSTEIERIIEYLQQQGEYAHVKGVDLISNVYKAQINNGSQFFLSMERGLPSGLRILVEKAIKDGELNSATNGNDLTNELLIITRGIIYNWCQCKGAYEIKNKIEIIISKYLAGYCIK